MASKTGENIINSTVIALIVVVMVVIAALIVATITNNSVFTDISTTGTNTNETVTGANNVTNSTLAIKATASDATCSLTTVHNATGGEVITSGNYTFYGSACNIILSATTEYNATNINVTYSYSYASGTSLAGVNITRVQNDFGSFVTNLIAFLAIMGTIIGVIWLVLYVRRLFDNKEGIQGITA